MHFLSSPPNVSASWPSGAFHYHNGVEPQGYRQRRQARPTKSAPEAPRRIPRWAACPCRYDSRGRLRVVHPRAHARPAPHGADSVDARVLRASSWLARSWSWMAAAATVLDEVYAVVRTSRWLARSWSWTVLHYWTRSTLSFSPPGGLS